MSSATVTHILARNFNDTDAVHGPVLAVAALPFDADESSILLAALEEAGLQNDQRAIWNTYPNLRKATFALLQIYSTKWPSVCEPGASAVLRAVELAFKRVSAGLDNGERDRGHVIANYLSGLASISEDIASVHAWGFHRKKAGERMHDAPEGFYAWANKSSFTEVRFVHNSRPLKNPLRASASAATI